MAKVLVVQPDFDYTTRYISAWAEKVVELANEKGISTICLKNKRASRKEFESVAKKANPRFIFINGHGDEDRVTGQDCEPLVEVKSGMDILKGKIVYSLSCKSAKILGRECIKIGTETYLGYDEDFIFFYDEKYKTNPKTDKTAKLFLDPTNVIPISLLKGHSAKQAHTNSQDIYRKTVIELLGSESSSENRSFVRYLIWNMNNQVCLGNKQAVI